MLQFTWYRDNQLAVKGDAHPTVATDWRPDQSGQMVIARAQSNQGLANNAQNELETMLSTL